MVLFPNFPPILLVAPSAITLNKVEELILHFGLKGVMTYLLDNSIACMVAFMISITETIDVVCYIWVQQGHRLQS